MRCSVVAVHFTTGCNLQCPFCYRPREKTGNEKPFSFFIESVKYIKELAPQIALGGGEPFLFPAFIKKLGMECKKHGVILNITTNGTLIEKMPPDILASMLENVTMISISVDNHKWRNPTEAALIARQLKKDFPGLLVGANLLLSPFLFDGKGALLYRMVTLLVKVGRMDRVFLLHPKSVPLGIDVLEFKDVMMATSTMYPGKIFCDDLTRQILDHGYPPWKEPCHFGKDIVSIDEQGNVLGCSFDSTPLLKMDAPSDILKITGIDPGQRFTCPYLKR